MGDAECPPTTDATAEVAVDGKEKSTGGGGEPQVINSSSLADPHVLEALKSQIKSSGLNVTFPSVIPKYLKKKVKALKKIQLEHVHHEAAFYREMQDLEMKYEKLFSPLYDKRRQIVVGEIEPTEEECDFPSDSEKDLSEEMDNMKVNDTEAEVGDVEEKGKDVKGMPEFWLTAFKNATMVADIIEEHDEPILKHLIDVKAVVDSNPMGFMLEFHFEPNEFFSNSVLTKYYEMKCEPDSSDPFSFDGPEIIKSKGCNIEWKKGMNVTVKTIKKKQKHKARGAVRMVTRTVQNDSFFNFFSPLTAPIDDEEEMDEDVRNSLTADFEIGNYIKDNIIPQAVLFFTGENLVDEDFDEEDEDEEFDEDEEESENETENPTVNKKKNRPGTQNPQPPECKQQ